MRSSAGSQEYYIFTLLPELAVFSYGPALYQTDAALCETVDGIDKFQIEVSNREIVELALNEKMHTAKLFIQQELGARV